MSIIDTVIVGAGPYGLSIAAHLRAAGLPFRILGPPLESWRSFMPEGMILKSEPFASNLWDPQRKFTLERFSRERALPYQASGKPVSRARFLDYADWFVQRAVGEVSDIKVKRLRREAQNFILDLEAGTSLEARRVILATGHMAFRYVPPELDRLVEPFCFHSTRLGELRAFSGRDVTIIGAGQSALESAALLREAGAAVRIVARTDRLIWNTQPDPSRSFLQAIRAPESGLAEGWRSLALAELPQAFRLLFPAAKRHRFVATSWGPSGSWWLRDRVQGHIDTLLGRRIISASESGGRVRLVSDGPDGVSEIWTDHIVAATGFKIDVERLDYLEPTLRGSIAREGQAPLLDSRFETSIPGLFIVGVPSAPTFGPVMRFMFGAKHVAPVLARRLKATAERRVRQV
jgi:cation diffusion facilitator CzcD-associated flavoprotein CzcO